MEFPSFSSFPSNNTEKSVARQQSINTTSSFPSFRSFPSTTHSQAIEFKGISNGTKKKDPKEKKYSSDTSDTGASTSTEDRRSDRKKDKKRKKKRKHGKDDKKRSRKKHRKEERNSCDEETASMNFYLDKKADESNLIYECIRDTAVPVYKRWCTSILGDMTGWHLGKSDTRKKLILNKRLYFRDSDKLNVKTLIRWRKLGMAATGDSVRVSVSREEHTAPASDYIEMPSFDDNTNERDDENVIAIEETPEYVAKSAEADKRVRETPNDVNTWLELVRVQDELMKTEKTRKRASLKRSIHEKKVVILEKALEANPNNELLLQEYLRILSFLWEPAKLLSKWDQILDDHPFSLSLWMAYLDLRQSNFASFSVTSCIDLYGQCISTLNAAEKSRPSDKDLLHIFNRVCLLLKQAGYIERAISAYQALLEFNLFRPAPFESHSFSQKLKMFEIFWESDCPRVGEAGAKGWANSLLLADEGLRGVPDLDLPALPFDEKDDPYCRFFVQELHNEYYLWLPSRHMTEEMNDPYRGVLFDDVRELLFTFSNSNIIPHAISSFLSLFNLPIRAPSPTKSTDGSNDAFLLPDLDSEYARNLFLKTSHNNFESNDNISRNELRFPVQSFPQMHWHLFGSTSQWVATWNQDDIEVMKQSPFRNTSAFLRNVMDHCFDYVRQDSLLGPFQIHFELMDGLKNAENLSKSILKDNRKSLILWNAYAQLLLIAGKVDQAEKVYNMTLQSLPTFPLQDQIHKTTMYASYALLKILSDKRSEAKSVLCHLGCDTFSSKLDTPSPTQMLKARKTFAETKNKLLGNFGTASTVTLELIIDTVDFVFGYALFEYLTRGLDESLQLFSSALESLSQIQKMDTAPAAEHFYLLEEFLLQQKMYILYLDVVTGSSYKPGTLRQELEAAMERFPKNTLFLTLYGWNEQKTKLDNRVRRRLDSLLISSPSPAAHLFSIWSEIHQRSVGNVNSIRASFNRAIDSESTSHCPNLWILYITFEVSQNNLSAAKALYYRGIKECPWSKTLYMTAMNPTCLRSAFTEAELKDVVNLMEEKEIRVREMDVLDDIGDSEDDLEEE